ncbi:hypothetical protein D034_2230A, partial [Vibrio parahaemolyticus Peru-288]|jgi:hypothetical protein
MKLT